MAGVGCEGGIWPEPRALAHLVLEQWQVCLLGRGGAGTPAGRSQVARPADLHWTAGGPRGQNLPDKARAWPKAVTSV